MSGAHLFITKFCQSANETCGKFPHHNPTTQMASLVCHPTRLLIIMKTHHYDSLSKFFHWIMAIVIIYASIAGFGMHLVEDQPAVHAFFSIMNMSLATVGAVIFIARYLWKYFRRTPQLPDSMSKKHQGLAKLTHSLLYFTMFVVFFSGFLMLTEGYRFFWLFTIPNLISDPAINHFFLVIHRAACMALTALFVVHIVGVIRHHFATGDTVLRSMMPNTR